MIYYEKTMGFRLDKKAVYNTKSGKMYFCKSDGSRGRDIDVSYPAVLFLETASSVWARVK